MLTDIKKNDISIYFHWPFCLKKCPYCDFNSHEMLKKTNYKHWKKSYSSEIDFETTRFEKKNIKSIFFGGGTPSLMPTEILEFILNRLSS